MIRAPWTRRLTVLLVGIASVFPHPALADNDPKAQMLLGNPDNANNSQSNKEHYLLKRGQFALSYNDKLHFPNWVAWHLNKKDIGNTERGKFVSDPDLPNGFVHIVTGDYSKSGYDRGHNCPSKDRSATRKDNDVAFYMSNITPQQHGMNAGPWEQLESYSRQLTLAGNELYILCGHGFSAKTYKRIGRSAIAVPDFGWKIIVVLPDKSGDDLARITAQTRVIAIKMPNISTISKKDWREFRTSPGELEAATGLHFFDALPKAVADTLKSKVDFDQSAPSKAKRPGSVSPKPTQSAGGQVWVNTKSKVYWRAGSRYYGKTTSGKYLSEAEAIRAGYHAGGGR